MDLAFYQWFLTRLIESLEGIEVERVTATTALSITPTAHVHDEALTVRQSNLATRPNQPGVISGTRSLGDGTRVTPPLLPSRGGVVPVMPPGGWLPPWPVMPPQTAPTSITWDGPQHAAHSFYAAEDGLWDAGYEREDGSGWCPPLPTDATPVEISGVLPRPGLRRCLADNKARPEHLAAGDRYNMRLPVMAGVDSNGRYLRVVKLPMKTHEYRA